MRHLDRIWVPVGLLFLVVALFMVSENDSKARHNQAERDSKQRHALAVRQERRMYTEVCTRNNITKAVIRTNVRRGVAQGIGSRQNIQRNDDLMPILDCQRTFKSSDGGVRLAQPIVRQYLRLIQRGWIPDVKDGVIVGKHRAESGPHADF